MERARWLSGCRGWSTIGGGSGRVDVFCCVTTRTCRRTKPPGNGMLPGRACRRRPHGGRLGDQGSPAYGPVAGSALRRRAGVMLRLGCYITGGVCGSPRSWEVLGAYGMVSMNRPLWMSRTSCVSDGRYGHKLHTPPSVPQAVGFREGLAARDLVDCVCRQPIPVKISGLDPGADRSPAGAESPRQLVPSKTLRSK